MPLVSVIMPTFNRAAHVGAAIESVRAQTMRDWELLVVDDASTDDTEGAVARIGDPRVRYVRQARNAGDAATRNAGIALSTGARVAFLDDDDIWVPEKLAWQAEAFERGGARVGLVYAGRETHFSQTGRTSVLPMSGEIEAQLRSFRITTSTVMVSREALEKAGPFDETMPCASDYDLWIRIWRAGFQFRVIDKPLVRYAVHGAGLSDNVRKVVIGEEMLLEKHASFFAEDSESLREIYHNVGVLRLLLGDVREARRALRRSIHLKAGLANSAYYLYSFLGASAGRRLRELRGWAGVHGS
jgi:glycosyltransferase involved in cell wall biosynthesis